MHRTARLGAFKLVNPTGPVGVIDTDRTTGIRAVLGAKPTRTTAITSSFRLGSHAARKGSTVSVYPTFAGQAAAGHVFLNAVKVLGYEGRGSAGMTFVVKGVRGNGKAFSITRTDVYADTFDLPAQARGHRLRLRRPARPLRSSRTCASPASR